MSTISPARSEPAVQAVRGEDMVVTLPIAPGGFDRFLDAIEDRVRPLIKYRQGSLTLVSPSYTHERRSDRLDDLVKAVCDVLNIPIYSTASTLYRRRGRDHGIEADRTYYLEHEAALRGFRGEQIDLDVYPPPDLAIEVIFTHGPTQSLLICQELGIPEVWVYWAKKKRLEFLQLDAAEGCYAATPSSRAFPFLTPEDVLPWVEADEDEPDNVWRRHLRAWVRDVLGPRRAGA